MSKFLIAGLGNPGEEYAETRHNIGFKIADALAGDMGLKFETQRYGELATGKIKGKPVFILKPSTFMNLSGKAINFWLQAEKIDVKNLIVLVDELALPLGKIRINPKGSDGGHNGLKNIQEVLGTTQYARLRFGISNEFSKGKQVDYVLGEWTKEEKEIIPERIAIAAEACKSFVFAGLENTMNHFNTK